MPTSLFGCFDPKVGRDAGRDFYVAVGSGKTACAGSPAVERVDTFVPIKATNNLVVKKAERKAAETQNEEPLVQ